MRKSIFSFSLLIFLFLAGCDDNNPTNPIVSITEEVKNALPVDDIYIYGLGSSVIHYGNNGRSFNGAYVSDGYLIVTLDYGTNNYFDLAKVKSLEINPKESISLRY